MLKYSLITPSRGDRPKALAQALDAVALAAEKAGLHAGDVLLTIDSKPIADTSAMLNLIAALKPNQKATFTIARADKRLNVVVMIAKRPKPAVQKD